MASLTDDDVNAATRTLKCDGPFDVLRLAPGVYEPVEIKRRYRRLALILHPDKNRHPDAEAAFKKLTTAFEKLHEPARQAASRAEAENSRGAPRHRKHNRESSSPRYSYSDGGGGGAQKGGSGSAEAPKWCREGEYVPEPKQEKKATTDPGSQESRPIDEFMRDFEQQEKVYKQEVAAARERNAAKNRAKAEARSAADQERMDRLREDVLGSSAAESAVEAKSASWQRFKSNKTAVKRMAEAGASGRRGKAKRGGDVTVGGDVNVKGGAEEGREGIASAGAVPPDRRPDPAEGTGGPGYVCWVCRRGFRSAKGLERHEAKSELHEINVQLRDFLSQ